jgi:hypothetical protein
MACMHGSHENKLFTRASGTAVVGDLNFRDTYSLRYTVDRDIFVGTGKIFLNHLLNFRVV